MANKPKPKQKEPAKTRPRTPAGKEAATIQKSAPPAAAQLGDDRGPLRPSAGIVLWNGQEACWPASWCWPWGWDMTAASMRLYFTPRMVYFFLVAILFILTWVLVARPGLRAIRLDWMDGAGLALVLWEVVTAAAAPIPNLAWFGTYNRTSGAFMWIALILIFLCARRLLDGTRALRPLVWAAAFVLDPQRHTHSDAGRRGDHPLGRRRPVQRAHDRYVRQPREHRRPLPALRLVGRIGVLRRGPSPAGAAAWPAWERSADWCPSCCR